MLPLVPARWIPALGRGLADGWLGARERLGCGAARAASYVGLGVFIYQRDSDLVVLYGWYATQ